LLLPVVALGGSPRVERAWIRLLPGDLPLAGYLVLDNPDARPLTLTGAHSAAFARIAMHESRADSGVARMRPVEQITIPPGDRLVFAPGGYHLMLLDRTRALQVGDQVPVLFSVRGALGR
jgi:copper(I)-binding protein